MVNLVDGGRGGPVGTIHENLHWREQDEGGQIEGQGGVGQRMKRDRKGQRGLGVKDTYGQGMSYRVTSRELLLKYWE